MGFFDRLKKALAGGGAGSVPAQGYWIYAQCRRCGEPLKARIDLRNELSQEDKGDTWIVRKGLVGSGARRCFQTVEVTLTFSSDKKEVLDQEATGGKLITAEEYEALLNEPSEETAEDET